MYQLTKMIQRDFLNLLMNPTWLFFCLLFPFLLITIVSFMTQGMYGEAFTSYDYYGVTLMFYSALYSGTFAANSFMEERIKKANLRGIYAPNGEWKIPFSKTIATFLYTLVIYSFVAVLVRGLFSINYGSAYFQLWLLFVGVNLASSSFGVLMCCVFKSEGVANQILSILTNIVAITAGLLFPAAAMGSLFSKISQWMPLSKVIQAAFELIYDNHSHDFLFAFGGSLLVALVFSLLSQLLFKGEAYV